MVAALAAAPARGSVYLNEVNIDGVVGQRFDNCTVIIDERGNVRIQAKGYAVKIDGGEPQGGRVQPPPPQGAGAPGNGAGASGYATTSAAPGRLSRRYFLVAEQSVDGGSQYEIDVFINAQWIRKIQGTDGALPIEVTRFFRPGQNRVFLAAKKAIVGDRRYFTRDVWMKVVIGEGNVGGDHVMIDSPLVVMTRTAADLDDRNEEYVVDAR
jgi:acetyltransferase-like isoleucine patch superfamily enzyme